MLCLEKQSEFIMNVVDRLLHEIRDGWLTADQREERIQQLARLNSANRQANKV